MYDKYGITVTDKTISNYRNNPDWVALNTRYSINGYMFGNLNKNLGLSLSQDSVVRWNILSFPATETGSYDSIHWEHNPIKDSTGHYTDYLTVTSPGYEIAAMTPVYIGDDLLIYNQDATKQSSGMIALYGVENDDYVSKLKQDSQNDDSAQLSNTFYNLFVFVIIVSVFTVIGLILYSMHQSNFVFPGSHPPDMTPILLESSHHPFAPPVQHIPSSSPSSTTMSHFSISTKTENTTPSASKSLTPPPKNVHVKHAEI
jgi:hypothetical protein